MGFHVSVEGFGSHNGRLAMTTLPDDDLERVSGVPCEADVHITSAHLLHHLQDEYHRPYLDMQGEVRSLRGDFPGNVTEVRFPEGKDGYPKVSFEYEFTDEELSELCLKGMFGPGFKVPQTVFDNDYELPVECSVCLVKRTDVPVLFVDVERPYNRRLDAETSGYMLGSYFDYAQKQEEDEFVADNDYEVGDVEDLFEGDREKMQERVEELEERPEETLTAEEKDLLKKLRRVIDGVAADAEEREKKKLEGAEVTESIEELEQAAKEGSIAEAKRQALEDEKQGLEPEPITTAQDGTKVYGDGKRVRKSGEITQQMQDLMDREKEEEGVEYASEEDFEDY